jgi:hypothetical protein
MQNQFLYITPLNYVVSLTATPLLNFSSLSLSISQLTVSRLPRQCGILNISQLYRPPRPVTEIALLYFACITDITHTTQKERPIALGYTSVSRCPQTETLQLRKEKQGSSHQTTILNTWWWPYSSKHVVWCEEKLLKWITFTKFYRKRCCTWNAWTKAFYNKWHATWCYNIVLYCRLYIVDFLLQVPLVFLSLQEKKPLGKSRHKQDDAYLQLP